MRAKKAKLFPPVTFQDNEIVPDSQLFGGGCPKCGKEFEFELGDGLDVKLSACCCDVLYVAYPETWKISIDNI